MSMVVVGMQWQTIGIHLQTQEEDMGLNRCLCINRYHYNGIRTFSSWKKNHYIPKDSSNAPLVLHQTV